MRNDNINAQPDAERAQGVSMKTRPGLTDTELERCEKFGIAPTDLEEIGYRFGKRVYGATDCQTPIPDPSPDPSNDAQRNVASRSTVEDATDEFLRTPVRGDGGFDAAIRTQ